MHNTRPSSHRVPIPLLIHVGDAGSRSQKRSVDRFQVLKLDLICTPQMISFHSNMASKMKLASFVSESELSAFYFEFAFCFFFFLLLKTAWRSLWINNTCNIFSDEKINDKSHCKGLGEFGLFEGGLVWICNTRQNERNPCKTICSTIVLSCF